MDAANIDTLLADGMATTPEAPADTKSFKRPKQTRNQRRAKKRDFLQGANACLPKNMRKAVAFKRAMAVVKTKSMTATDLQTESIHVAEGGWLGSRKPVLHKGDAGVKDLLRRGYKLVKWNGV